MYPKSPSVVAFVKFLSMLKRAPPYRLALDIMENALSLIDPGVSVGEEVKRSLSTAGSESVMVCWVVSGRESAVKMS
jgi:hypothetical protein